MNEDVARSDKMEPISFQLYVNARLVKKRRSFKMIGLENIWYNDGQQNIFDTIKQ
jgi:hypothetical protein